MNGISGEIVWSPAISDKHIQLKEPIEREFKLPVTVANCLAIAIRQQARYQHFKDFAVVMLGYGIDMGIFVKALPLKGA